MSLFRRNNWSHQDENDHQGFAQRRIALAGLRFQASLTIFADYRDAVKEHRRNQGQVAVDPSSFSCFEPLKFRYHGAASLNTDFDGRLKAKSP